MIPHVLKIGDVIYDEYTRKWGKVNHAKIGHTQKVYSIPLDENMSKVDIVYNVCYKTPNGEWVFDEKDTANYVTKAGKAYPLLRNRLYKGYDVCMEINRDWYDTEHDYDYFCPHLRMHCWEYETDERAKNIKNSTLSECISGVNDWLCLFKQSATLYDFKPYYVKEVLDYQDTNVADFIRRVEDLVVKASELTK